jgi:hypothetical protein
MIGLPGGAGLHAEDAAIVAEDGAGHGDTFGQPGAGLLRGAGQRLVEVEPAPDQAVPGVAGQLGPGQLEPDPAADDAQPLVPHPAVLLADGHAHADQGPDGTRGQPVTADFLPRERGLLQHQHVDPGAGQVARSGRTGWPGPDHDDVGFFGDFLGHETLS